MEVARKFYGKFLPQLGFVEERPVKNTILFIPPAAKDRLNSFVSHKTKIIGQTAHASRFGRTRAKKWIGLRNSCATLVGKNLRGRKFARATVRVTTPSFSKTPMATNSKFAAARSRYLPVNL
jgi:hypothetical protein